MKKWWFSIVMFIFALIILSYGTVLLYIGEIELFYQSGIFAIYGILALLVLIIGLASIPSKEEMEK